ncbi:NAD(P)-dependent oxidoreductase [Streptococcus gallolyticus subsp. gallolyticus]|nr:NAD(P)-dependent oxidoreductase [Streptococcus gallolyticus]MCY7155184.1 NAD(P)-dependent oxidoreductase [Streptococcus gallolyticus subsp. gallolyticus]MCY7173939.1 NAD(P)-dependent oxidoreductase [Streptococcus gallolyticus subsp. gallolyticus]MCY7176059.1 NAD(P)-dependent oxidoreductase [Streptococcus gallolyticus subsp. gallolyticus]MCY7180513.1 NAD(P)-dependent oxidoreductase [Streptococcus gallolyticus subsp. gallolyticus]MCY7198065.1 NAD(P)-dependent oxidoreductase [Streptococcus gal
MAKKDSSAEFYVLSRSGKNELKDSRIKNIAVDVTSVGAVEAVLPEKIDYIIDFIGRPEKDVDLFKKVNNLPAQVMLRVAEKHRVKAMGFIGGVLGPKSFVNGKKLIIESLEKSDIPLAVVEPTIVYGNGRADTLAKMVPILKVVGVLVKMLKPVHVDDVANELITQLIKRS